MIRRIACAIPRPIASRIRRENLYRSSLGANLTRVTGAIELPFAATALRAGRPHSAGGSYFILPGNNGGTAFCSKVRVHDGPAESVHRLLGIPDYGDGVAAAAFDEHAPKDFPLKLVGILELVDQS